MERIIKLLVGVVLAIASVLPANFITAYAQEIYTIVDDTQTDAAQQNYFTYSTAKDTSGLKGWASDKKNSIQDNEHADAAKTQHWVWNGDNTEASKHTYTFTFEGTGVILYGVKNDATNTFQIDDEAPQSMAITGSANQITPIYIKKNLPNGKHVVKVTLPNDGSHTGLQVSYAKVFKGESTQDTLEKTTIPFTKMDGTSNKFTYSSTGWSSFGSSTEHVWSDNPADKNTWYEVTFTGSKIDIHAGKNRPMGNVKYTVDGVDYGTYSLYNNGNINSTLIKTIDGLTEGKHILRAEATGEKEANATGTGIDCADVVVYHAPYTVTDFSLKETNATLTEGATFQIQAIPVPDYASLKGLTYISDNPNVASVDTNGLVSANGVGKTTIRVKASNTTVSKTVDITVQESSKQIKGSIVDTNTQYTQGTYQTVKGMGTMSKTVSAWVNDKAISELALISIDSKLKNVAVEASDFKNGQNTIAKSNITTTFIKSTKAYNGAYLGYGSTTRPVPAPTKTNRSESNDILYQTTPIEIPYNAVQPVWVEIHVPKGTVPGTYTGTIQVKADGIDTPLTFTYTVDVQDAQLPDASAFEKNFDIELWQYPYTSAEYYNVKPFSQKHLDILKPIMEKYKSIGGHAITTSIIEDAWGGQTYSKHDIHYPSMVKWIKNADGSFSYDYTDFDKWVQFNKDLGIGDKIVIYSIAPWNNAFTYWDNGKLIKESYTVGSKRYTAVWTAFLQNLVQHLDNKGWFQDAYIGIDERGFSKAAFDLVDSVKNKDGKVLKTAGAMDGFVDKHDLAMRVTDLNVGDTAAAAHPDAFAQLLKDRKAKGDRTTLYSCTEHEPGNFSLSAPSESYWSIVNAGKAGTAGFLRWAYDAWVEDPLQDATHNAFEPGDAFLIYPDKKDAVNPQVHSSVRLEKMAEGVRDVNKIAKMVKEVPSLQGDVQALYAKITMQATTSRSYLNAAQRQKLAAEMDAFKAGLHDLTAKYIAIKAHGTTTVSSIAIQEGSQLSIAQGNTKQLHAVILPDTLLDGTATWSTDDKAIVAVDANGLIQANKVGTAIITATANADPSKKASIQVTVTKSQIDQQAEVSYYNFDDGNVNQVKDSWGSASGTGSQVSSIDGISGKALDLTTAQSKVSIENPAKVGTTWSVSMWVYQQSSTTQRASLLWDGAGDPNSVSIDAANGPHNSANPSNIGVHVNNGDNGVLSIPQSMPIGKWTNLTLTNSKSEGLSFYMNGNQVGSTNTWTKTHDMQLPNKIIGGLGFIGKLDEVKIYNKALTAGEVRSAMAVHGLNIAQKNIEMEVGKQERIETNLISDASDKTVTYKSLDPSIASVDANGVVSGKSFGDTWITVQGGGYEEKVFVRITKELPIQYTIPQYNLPDKDITTFARSTTQYYGQPDMVMLDDNKTMIGVYPEGHGVGNVLMKRSEDAGKTWHSVTNTPSSWKTSQETPTLYKLDFKDGSQKLIMITGCPAVWGDYSTGWQTSISNDGGKTWSEYKRYHEGYASTVAMASLIRLKDKDGNYMDKWMGVFHNGSTFVNYKTYLTFDKDGNEQWSEPQPYLSEWRDIESKYQICEVGMFRSPDGKRIMALARSQSHMNKSTMFYSDDEGKTWSKPRDLPGALQGERHKIAYDPVSGRLLVTFREITLDYNKNGKIESNDWRAGDWVAWVGTYDDLMKGKEGQYRIRLKQDFTNNAKGGDCGYAGVSVQPDGTFTLISYGHFDKKVAEANHTGNARNDPAYIVQAQFKLSEIDNIAGLIDRNEINDVLDVAGNLKEQDYTAASWNTFKQAYTNAVKVNKDDSSSQKELQAACDALKAAQHKLQKVYTITTKVNNTEYGMVSGSGTFLENSKVRVRATANKGYHFVHWKANGSIISTDTVYEFNAKQNVEMLAVFVKDVANTPQIPDSGGTIVTDKDTGISVYGAVAAGSILQAQKLDEKSIHALIKNIKDKAYLANVNIEAIFNLKLQKDGNHIQPDSMIKVYVPLVEDTLQKNLQVIYIGDNGNITIMPHTLHKKGITFDTTHFSYYGIVSMKENKDVIQNTKVNTADETNNNIFFILSVLSLGVCLYVIRKKYYNNKER